MYREFMHRKSGGVVQQRKLNATDATVDSLFATCIFARKLGELVKITDTIGDISRLEIAILCRINSNSISVG